MENVNMLQIIMFGDFSLTYGEKKLKLERTNNTKAMQVLQLLIYYGENGVMRDTLLDLLYSDDNAAEPTNNLKVTISNLRRLLLRSGLPEDTTVSFHGGSYFWRCSVPVKIDIVDFEQSIEQAKHAEPAEQIVLWKKVCALYKGDFLPHLQSEGWAVAAGAGYREQYFACVRGLIRELEKRQQWEELLPIVTEASALYGIEDFRVARIDCLMNLERFAEAKQVYEDTVKELRSEFDIGPSEELLKRCRDIDVMFLNRPDSIQSFQEKLSEQEEERGAYYCTYPGFIDAYRVISRMLERNGQSAYLVLCWLTDNKGHALTDIDRLAVAVPKASQAIRTALRRGDLYTQPARDRFLILLVGTNQENCSIITSRIQDSYRRDSARGVALSFRLSPVDDAMNREMFREKPEWDM